MKYKIYNEEGILVAVNIKEILELLELNGYEVVKEKRKRGNK
jgi:predicted RNA binding protein YcfA (HicA-like mRNA interferase family)